MQIRIDLCDLGDLEAEKDLVMNRDARNEIENTEETNPDVDHCDQIKTKENCACTWDDDNLGCAKTN